MTRKNDKYAKNKAPRKTANKSSVSFMGVTVKKTPKRTTGALKKVVGKIGYCDNATLGLKDEHGKPMKGGHYVYIREENGGKCNVNVVTSLENKNGYFDNFKLNKVKNGYLYPVPKGDADFTRWSAINLDGNINGVDLTKIQNIGRIKMRRRHNFFVGKFTKKQ